LQQDQSKPSNACSVWIVMVCWGGGGALSAFWAVLEGSVSCWRVPGPLLSPRGGWAHQKCLLL